MIMHNFMNYHFLPCECDLFRLVIGVEPLLNVTSFSALAFSCALIASTSAGATTRSAGSSRFLFSASALASPLSTVIHLPPVALLALPCAGLALGWQTGVLRFRPD